LQEGGGNSPARATTRFSREWREFQLHIDRWELFNRYEVFGWVAERGNRAHGELLTPPATASSPRIVSQQSRLD
jgi:hypothetical protein